MADGSSHHQGTALGAVQQLADIVAFGLGGGQVIGLDQGGDVGIVNGGVGGDDRDAGGLGFGDGVFEDGGIHRADDDGGWLGGDLGVDGLDLGRGILRLGGQVNELHTLGRSFRRSSFAQPVPVIVAGGVAGVGDRDGASRGWLGSRSRLGSGWCGSGSRRCAPG